MTRKSASSERHENRLGRSAIPMDDGVVLRADVFRPVNEGRYPVLLTYGPYAKGLAFQDGYPDAWETMVREHPDVPRVPATCIKTGKWWTLKNGCHTATFACAWIAAVAGVRPVTSILFRRARLATSLHVLNGRGASLEQRQSGPQRHFLLRDQPVAGGLAATAASGGHVRMGRRCGMVSRYVASRRDLLHILGELV